MASKSNHQLNITTKVKDLASSELRQLGKTGKMSAATIATGFVAAQAAIMALRGAIRGVTSFVKALTTEAAAQGDAFAKMSLRIGASVEALSAYKHVAELSGVSMNTLTMAWQRQTRRIAEAANGTGEAKDALRELGLIASDLNRLAPEQQFEALADALSGVENKADRVRLAMKLWDSEGVRLVQIVNQGSEAIRAMKQDAHDLGLVWTEDAARSAEAFNDSMLRVERSIDGVKKMFAEVLLPVLVEAMDDITQSVMLNKDNFRAWAVTLKDNVVPWIEKTTDKVSSLISKLETLANVWDKTPLSILSLPEHIDKWLGNDVYSKITSGMWSNAKDPRGGFKMSPRGVIPEVPVELYSRKPSEQLQSDLPLDIPSFAPKYGDYGQGGRLPIEFKAPSLEDLTTGRLPMEFVAPSLEDLMSGPNSVPALNEAMFEGVDRANAWSGAMEEADTTLTDMARDGLYTVSNAFSSFFSAMISGTADTASAFRAMATDILSSLAQLAMNQVFMQIANAILPALGGAAAGGATPTPTSNWTPAGGVPAMADGGVVSRPTFALIGEKGPEAVIPLDQLRSGRGGGTTLNMVVQPSPGMDEMALAEYAAAAVSRRLREDSGFRRQIRGTARGGLY